MLVCEVFCIFPQGKNFRVQGFNVDEFTKLLINLHILVA